jgi:predicted metal-dependent HD superfamily phosphohydrolase
MLWCWICRGPTLRPAQGWTAQPRAYARGPRFRPRAKDNELLSAEAASAALAAAGLPATTAARCAELILATASHLHGPDRDAHVVVDADLAVLGAPLPRYAAYADAVRREWCHLSDEEFLVGR